MAHLVVLTGEGGLDLAVDLYLLHVHVADTELEDGVPVVFGEVVAIHEGDNAIDGFFAIQVEFLDKAGPEDGDVLLADFVAVAGGVEAHVALDFFDEADKFT